MDGKKIDRLLGSENGYTFLQGMPVPDAECQDTIDHDSVCKGCGAYKKSYICQEMEGSDGRSLSDLAHYDEAAVLSKDYKVDRDDSASIYRIRNSFQNLCRMVSLEYQASGDDVFPMSSFTGKCSHCNECNCVKGTPCGCPDSRVSPMKCYGISEDKYLDEIGVKHSSDPDTLTLCGLFLTKKQVKTN